MAAVMGGALYNGSCNGWSLYYSSCNGWSLSGAYIIAAVMGGA